MTPQREQARERIGDRQGLIRELAIAADVSDGVIRGLVKTGAIEAVEVDIDSPFPLPDPGHAVPTLSPDQHAAAQALVAAVDARDFEPWLFDGVPGSGKTDEDRNDEWRARGRPDGETLEATGTTKKKKKTT